MATVQLMNAAAMKLRMAAGPATSIAAPEPSKSPVPMEPPTATIAICPAVSWWRRPDSLVGRGGLGALEDKGERYQISEGDPKRRGEGPQRLKIATCVAMT